MTPFYLKAKAATVVGCGKIGSLYSRYLRQSGFQVSTVDPVVERGARYQRVADVPPQISIWIVCTPTDQHLATVEAILRRDPEARILIEKPLCPPGDIDAAQSLFARFPRAQLAVNDTYGTSPVVHRFVQLVVLRAQPIDSLSIELSKNRNRDEQKGRFIDRDFGDFGYEGFHLLSLRDAVTDRVPMAADRVRLFTSVRGRIGFPHLRAARLYESQEACRSIARAQIPFASEFRYRAVEATFCDGSTVSLVFEPYYGLDFIDFKNTHLIESRNAKRELFRETIQANQLQEAFLSQVRGLLSGRLKYDRRTWERLGEMKQRARAVTPTDETPTRTLVQIPVEREPNG